MACRAMFFAVALAIFNIAIGENVNEAELRNLSQIAYNDVLKSESDPRDWFDGIENWESPEKVKKGCPWYVMGRDMEKRLVFVWEIGHCDFVPFVIEGTPEDAANLDKHVAKLLWKIEQTCKDAEDENAMLVMDARGYNGGQLTYLEVLKHKLSMARLLDHTDSCIANPVIINLTFVSQLFLNLIQPIAGGFVGRQEKFSRQETWEPWLKNKIPKDQLPPFYGGSDDFKPLEV